MKSKLPKGIPVGTADTWNRFADGTGDPVVGVADIILVNAFAFWQGAEVGNATHVLMDDVFQAMQRIERIAKEKGRSVEVW